MYIDPLLAFFERFSGVWFSGKVIPPIDRAECWGGIPDCPRYESLKKNIQYPIGYLVFNENN